MPRKRISRSRGISPVLATVILIAITLVASVAIAGFVFGLFAGFQNQALVSSRVTSCSNDGIDTVCSLLLFNSGSANVNIQTNAGCGTLSYQGKSIQTIATNSCVGAGSNIVRGGNPLQVTMTFAVVDPVTGQGFVGKIYLSNGNFASFSGAFA